MDTSVSDHIRPLFDSGRATIPGVYQVKSDTVHLDAAIDWLCHSQDVTDTGGSAATYNLLLGWEAPYPETSGYIIPTLFKYADLYDSDVIRERAIAMSEWTLSTQHETGSFPGGTGGDGAPNAFNTGQIILGLAEAYNQTGEKKYQNAINKACHWLVDVQSDEGHWAESDYKSQPHVYTARISWSILLGADLIEEDTTDIIEAALNNLYWVINKQQSNGWFRQASFESDEDPFLHTIAYTIRGLIEAGILLENDDIFESGKKAADKLLEIQGKEGVLKGSYDENWSSSWYYCLTGNAQMAIVWIRLFELTGDQDYLIAARTAVQFLKRHQPLDASINVRGGIPGSYPLIGKYVYLRYPNWAAKFFADALLKLLEYRKEKHKEQPNSAEKNRSDSEPLQMCLLVDGEHVFRWVAEAIEKMLEATNTEISLVVINEDSGLLSSGNVKRGKKYPAYAVFRILLKQFARFDDSPRYDDSVHISNISDVSDADWIRTYPDNVDGLWNEIPPEVVDEIRSTSDIVFRRGFGLIRGDILTATEYGVISYHHGDPRKYRGGPAGFWEFMHDEERAGMMVQTLRDELDAGIIQSFSEVEIRTCQSWGEIRNRLYNNSIHLLADAVKTIISDDGPTEIEEFGPVHTPPSVPELANYFVKRIRQQIER